MIRRPPRSTRTDTRFPYTTLFRSHIGANGNYRPSSTYVILLAEGGVEGRFDAVTSTYAFLTPTLRYGHDSVRLRLDRNDVRFSDVAASSNQQATGAALERMAAGSKVQDAVLMSDARSEEHTSELQSLMRNSYAVF